MVADANVVLLAHFGAGLMIGGLVRVILRRPLVLAVTLAALAAIFVACLSDPSCHAAKCMLDGALTDCAGAITWWISNPVFALGCALGFTIAAVPPNSFTA